MRFDTMKTVLAIRDRRDVPAPIKPVLLVLALRANERAQCWPSLKTIGFDAGVSRKTAMRCVAELVRRRLVAASKRTDERGDPDSSLYTITCGVWTDGDHVVPQSPQVVTESPHPGDAPSPGVVPERAGGSDSQSPKDLHLKTPKEEIHGRREMSPALLAALSAPSTRKRSSSDRQGTRIAQDWRPSDQLRAWCRTELQVDPGPIADRFRDYWRAADGPSARKRDWEAAFRNWARRDKQDGKAPTILRASMPTRDIPPARDMLAGLESLADSKAPTSAPDKPMSDLFDGVARELTAPPLSPKEFAVEMAKLDAIITEEGGE